MRTLSEAKPDDVIATVKIQTLRDKYDPNYRVIVVSQRKLEHLGDFDEMDWNYAYHLSKEDIDVYTIQKTTALPPDCERFVKALETVDGKGTWHVYELILKSDAPKSKVEHEIQDWFDEEYDTHTATLVWVYKLPKVKSTKRIPITWAQFQKTLQKKKSKMG